MKKCERERFVKGATAILEKLGATPGAELSYTHTLETTCGPLWCQVDDHHTKGPGSVFCRFENAGRASVAGTGCNPFSGKWNFHYFAEGPRAVDQALANLEWALSLIAEPQAATA